MAIAPLRRAVLDEPVAAPAPGTPAPVRLAEPPPPMASSAPPAGPVAVAVTVGGTVRDWLRANTAALLLAACSLGGLVLLWHLVTTYRVDFYVRFSNIPTPLDVLHSMVQAGSSGKFIANIGMSLRRIFLGFAVAVALGVTLGLLIGRYRRLRQLVFPALEALRPVPGIAWVPISIMLWPDNEVSIVFITFIGAFFPILLNTVAGVEAVDAVLLRAGQCLGAKERQIMWHVVLPGAAPQIFTGLAVGMGVAWVSLIAAEMISGQFGIGYFTWEAYSLIAYADIVLGMITIGVLGLVCSGLIRLAAKLLLPWLEFTKLGGRT
jgi:NitT/TauT family transport system permease protein